MQVCMRNAGGTLRQLRRVATLYRYESTLPRPELEVSGEAPVSRNVLDLADQICKLSLLETGQLTKVLKDRLGIGELTMAAPAAAPGAAAAAAEPVEEEKKEEKNYFDVKLVSINPASKIKLIKAVKEVVPGITLVAAKKLVEGAPIMIKENIPKADAEALQAKLTEQGAEIALE